MFKGIIFNKGKVKNILRSKNSLTIEIVSNLNLKKKDLGTSISCNGACLTITAIKQKSVFFYLSKETLLRTNFSHLSKGNIINLEKSLKHGQLISGSYTQGHVDTTGIIKNIRIIDKSWVVRIAVKKQFKKYLIEKATITLNGVSLTISKVIKNNFEISIIPHTLSLTNLDTMKIKELINIEFDIFIKYLSKLDI